MGGATVIPGAMFIPESRVGQKLSQCGGLFDSRIVISSQCVVLSNSTLLCIKMKIQLNLFNYEL